MEIIFVLISLNRRNLLEEGVKGKEFFWVSSNYLVILVLLVKFEGRGIV